jgi:hypothetical protein
LEIEVWSKDPSANRSDTLIGTAMVSMRKLVDGEGVERMVRGTEVVSRVWEGWVRVEGKRGKKKGEVWVGVGVEDCGVVEKGEKKKEEKVERRARSSERRTLQEPDLSGVSEGTMKHLARRGKKEKEPRQFDEMTSTVTLAAEIVSNEVVRQGQSQTQHQRDQNTPVPSERESELALLLEDRERALQRRVAQIAEKEDSSNALYSRLLERERAVQRAEDEAQRILVDLEREKERLEREFDDRSKRWDETRAHSKELERARLEMAEERVRRVEKEREEAEEGRRRVERERERLQSRLVDMQVQLMQAQNQPGKEHREPDKGALAVAVEVAQLTAELHRAQAICEDVGRRLERERQAAAHYKERYRAAVHKLGEYKRAIGHIEYAPSGSVGSDRRLAELEELRRELDYLRQTALAEGDRDRPVTRANTETRSRGLDADADEWDEGESPVDDLQAEEYPGEEDSPLDSAENGLGRGLPADNNSLVIEVS